MKFATKAVHWGEEIGKISRFGDVVAPIHLSSTFARERLEEPLNGYEYSRGANPTRHVLEERLAAVEDALGALAFSTGMGAETTAALLLCKNSRILVTDDVYGGTYRLFTKCLSKFGMDFRYSDLTDLEKVSEEMNRHADMVWIETPTNPTLRIIDIRAVAEIAHDRNPQALVVVDNTLASPYFQRPLELGADLVVYSTTKYLSGHSDVLGGALLTNDEWVLEQLRFLQRSVGATPSPIDCFLILRGIKTLPLRMEKHQENATEIAKYLQGCSMVQKVIYPGLYNHPDHELAGRQMSGFSGMISFEASPVLSIKKFLESMELFALAESLGGVESLIEHPASMSHRTIPQDQRLRAGLSESLVRLSVGIEAKEDLIADLEQAFEKGTE